MKIEHANGLSVETNELPDVDAILMEESQKIHALFKKYNRQMFLVGEMRGMNDKNFVNGGCVFFYIMPELHGKTSVITDEYSKATNIYWSRIDGHIRLLTNHQLGIGIVPPPQVQPYPTE